MAREEVVQVRAGTGRDAVLSAALGFITIGVAATCFSRPLHTIGWGLFGAIVYGGLTSLIAWRQRTPAGQPTLVRSDDLPPVVPRWRSLLRVGVALLLTDAVVIGIWVLVGPSVVAVIGYPLGATAQLLARWNGWRDLERDHEAVAYVHPEPFLTRRQVRARVIWLVPADGPTLPWPPLPSRPVNQA